MVVFFTFDVTILLTFILLGVFAFGASFEAIVHFITNNIHIVYPIFTVTLAIVLGIYYVAKRFSISTMGQVMIDDLDCTEASKHGKKITLDRKMIVFIINSPLLVLCPVAGIDTLVRCVVHDGFYALFTVLFIFIIVILFAYAILALFVKAWNIAEEKHSYSRLKMLCISVLLFIPQYISYEVISTLYD